MKSSIILKDKVNKLPLTSLEKENKNQTVLKAKPSLLDNKKKIHLSNKHKPSTETLLPKRKKIVDKIKVYVDPPKVTTKPLLKVQKETSKVIMLTLFEEDIFDMYKETPIFKLPADCLIAIFNLCNDITTFSILSTVCQRWRKTLEQPFLWKEMNISHKDISKAMININSDNNQQFQHVLKLIIESKAMNNFTRNIELTTISPFKRLEILQLNNINLNDIEFITLWIKDIKIMDCQNIPVSKKGYNYMPNLSRLKQLNRLKLQFKSKCNLRLAYFTSIPNLKNLPTSLETLELINIFDTEEDIITNEDILALTNHMLTMNHNRLWTRELPPLQILDTWLKLESELVLKYKMFSFLSNLKSLTLDRISSYTTRIWNECLLPISSNLTFLSLTGWSANRESPNSIVKRKIEKNNFIDIDQAFIQFISSLSSIEIIILDDFMCNLALIQGLSLLNKNYIIQDNQQLQIDKLLFNFKITIKS